jgi:peptidyl-prolyl cis-trans isomerase D
MLNTFRESLKHGTWPKLVLGATAIGLTAYLGAYFSCEGRPQGDGNWAAMIDGNPITVQTFLSTARRLDQQYRRLFGDNYEQFKSQAKIGSRAVQALIERELVLSDAAKLGITVSPDEIVERIREEFTDPATGEFIGRDRYVTGIRRSYPGGVTAFERDLSNDLLMEKWTDMVTGSVSVSEDELVEVFRQRNERTAVKYVIVPSAEQNIDTSLSDEDLARWYEEHQELYRRDEGRRIRYVQVERRAQLDAIEITDDEVRAAYESNQTSYSHPEQRRARHILLRVAPDATPEAKEEVRRQAESLLERLRGGESFEELAAAYSQDPGSAKNGGDLGYFGRGQMVPEFENAVFGASAGDPPALVESDYGFHIFELTDTRPAGVSPLEDVADEIRRVLKQRGAQERVVAEAQRLRGEIGSADRFETVAESEGLKVESRFLTRKDRLADLGVSPEFMETVFDLEAGSVSPPLRTARGMVLVAVDEIVPPSLAPLDEVSETVGTDLLNDRSRNAALAAAARAVQRKGDFEAVARALGKEVQESGDLAPGATIPGTGGSTPEMQEKLFGPAVVEGDRGAIQVPSGALVYEVVRRVGFDSYAFEDAKPELRRELLQERRATARQAILDQIAQRREILVNNELVEQYDG